jgi:hypothetical protein
MMSLKNFMKGTKAMLSVGEIEGWVIGIILVIIAVIVIFQIIGNTGATVVIASNNASASGLQSLRASSA